MRTLVAWKMETIDDETNEITLGPIQFWMRTQGEDCSQDRVVFNELPLSQQTTQSVSVLPESATGWELRDCVDSRPFCSRGPSITALTLFSPSSIRVGYDGVDLTSIDWKIEQAGQPVRSGNSGTLTTNYFTISLVTPLPLGNYTIVLDGATCKTTDPSGSRRAFVVSDSVEQPLVGQLTYGANPNILTVAVENDGSKWRLRKVANALVASGEQELLYINGHKRLGWGGYDYLPGDQVSVYYAIAPSEDTETWDKKAHVIINLGEII